MEVAPEFRSLSDKNATQEVPCASYSRHQEACVCLVPLLVTPHSITGLKGTTSQRSAPTLQLKLLAIGDHYPNQFSRWDVSSDFLIFLNFLLVQTDSLGVLCPSLAEPNWFLRTIIFTGKAGQLFSPLQFSE